MIWVMSLGVLSIAGECPLVDKHQNITPVPVIQLIYLLIILSLNSIDFRFGFNVYKWKSNVCRINQVYSIKISANIVVTIRLHLVCMCSFIYEVNYFNVLNNIKMFNSLDMRNYYDYIIKNNKQSITVAIFHWIILKQKQKTVVSKKKKFGAQKNVSKDQAIE